MDCRIEITWNGKLVLKGECSRVMAYNVVSGLRAEYVNATKAGFELFTLQDVYNAFPGTVFQCIAGDGTGDVSYLVEVVK